MTLSQALSWAIAHPEALAAAIADVRRPGRPYKTTPVQAEGEKP